MSAQEDAPRADDGRVLAVHLGQSANCSSVGSVVDALFVSGVIGSAVLAALAVLVQRAADRERRASGEHETARATKSERDDAGAR